MHPGTIKYLLPLLLSLTILIACNQQHHSKTGPGKPIITTDLRDTCYPLIFEAAYQPHTVVRQGGNKYNFNVYSPGNITVESGKLIACDPIVMHDRIPFTQYFPPGQYPVELAIADDGNYDLTAFARIRFSDQPVAKWKYALLPGQEPLALTDSVYYCFGVDFGTAIFIDSVANTIFKTEYSSNWTRIFTENQDRHAYHAYVHTFGTRNVAVFTSGYGDGCYSAYIGFDADANVCRLLIDFMVVEWWK